MYLRRLDLSGFKSFPDPTTILFDRGITAVVGPNGCGKTNILDAIRWALGEQRPRLLRGGKMDEVIFSGTRQRPPLNMSEVILVLDNGEGRLPLPYDEVSVARRLFRSGESEYLLNKATCRLKDIHDLFSDTGLGAHSYSVIGQGMIDSLLSENPDDRRFLFEEAAGISKYKSRKKEALNKLKGTEADLLRVQDVRAEVEKRVKELRVQVARAKRHKKLTDKLAASEWIRLIGKYGDCQERIAEINRDSAEATLELEKYQAALTEDESALIELQEQLAAAESAAKEVSDQLANAVNAAHQAEKSLVQQRERRDHLQDTIERLTSEIASRTDNRERFGQNLQEIQQELRELRERQATHEEALQEAERAFDEEEQRLAAVRETKERLSATVSENERKFGELQADLTLRREQIEQWESERSDVEVTLTEARAEAKRYAERHTQLAQEMETTEQTLQQRNARLEQLQDEQSLTRKKFEALTAQVGDIEKSLAGLQAQVSTLEEMVARGGGLGPGTEAVLEARETFPGVVDAWVQRISTNEELTPALEAVLAGVTGALWCDSQETAAAVEEFATRKATGRVGIWDPSLPIPNTPTWDRPPVDDAGFQGWLLDFCQMDAAVRPMAAALLFSVILASTKDAARRIFCHFAGQYPVVSRDGTAFIPPGLIYAGTGETSVTGRVDLLESLKDEIEKQSTKLQSTSEELQSVRDQLSALEDSIHQATGERDETARRVDQLTIEVNRTETLLSESNRRVGEMEGRSTKLTAAITTAQERCTQAETEQTNWQRDRSTLAEELATATNEFSEHETQYRAALNTLNERRMAGIELKGLIERTTQNAQRTEETLEENKTLLTDRTREKERAVAEQEQLTASITQQEAEWTELLAKRDALTEERNAALRRVDEIHEQVTRQEKEVRQQRSRRDEAESTVQEWRVKLSENQVTLEHITRVAAEQFRKSPDDLTRALEEEPGQPLTDDEIIDLKAKIERIGAVNLLALEEYERERERLDFLESQIKDLHEAQVSLNKTINELNRTAGERFLVTFESARLNFQSVFTDLFQGGEADVRLEDPDNPLESPIEIFARPRGKKALGIRHLSGGERALTAIGMLFGLYLVKPSPFCILDEVDAPLDDANTVRFLRLVERFKPSTQFVIITHNKLTMEHADNLYGVTMEHPGVSRVVSVRLNPETERDDTVYAPLRRDEKPVVIIEDE